ncbi:hypothetical protein FACS1894110_07150 [Spirochaetia bacterium]|nr:hypothetical protein FACS1894110_07150 [Spirochaetia bacterium]
MKNRSLVLGTIALLLTAVVFLGCPTEATDSETKTTTNTVFVTPEITATTTVDLVELLAGSQFSRIGVGGLTITTLDVTVPSGKTLILQGAIIFAGGEKLIVDGGKVYVTGTGTLTPGTGSVEVINGGNIEVLADGNIEVADVGKINDGNGNALTDTVLGTSAVTVNAYGNLTYSGTIDPDDGTTTNPTLVQAWTAAGNGNLVLSSPTFTALKIDYTFPGITGGINPPTKADKSGYNTHIQHALIATVTSANTSATTVNIPAGVILTADDSDTLTNLTSLTVNGVFIGGTGATVPAGLISGTITGNGWVDFTGATVALLWTEVEALGGISNSKAVLKTGSGGGTLSANSTVPAGMYLTGPAGAIELAGFDLTVNGTLNVVNSGGLILTGAGTAATTRTSTVSGNGVLLIGGSALLGVTGGAGTGQATTGGTATLTVNVVTNIVSGGKLLATGGAGSAGSGSGAAGKGGGGATLILQKDVTFAAPPAPTTLLAKGGAGAAAASTDDGGSGGGALITGNGHIKGPSAIGAGTSGDVATVNGGTVHSGTGANTVGAGEAAPGVTGANGAGATSAAGKGGAASITNV